MIDNLVNAFDQIFSSIQENFHLLALIILLLWGIQFLNFFCNYRLNLLGIYPRSIFGLPGIITAPFLHGSFQHLFFNTIPLLVLGALVLVNGETDFLKITSVIILASGLATWLFGRRALHVGASGVVLGYWGFLLFTAYIEQSAQTFVLGFLCLYYFGGLFLNLFPSEEKVSWEGHVFGFFAGLLASYLFTHNMWMFK